MSVDVFDRIDVANKGYITRAELSDYVMRYNLSAADTQTIVDSLIPLHTNNISKKDFMQIFHETVVSDTSPTGSTQLSRHTSQRSAASGSSLPLSSTSTSGGPPTTQGVMRTNSGANSHHYTSMGSLDSSGDHRNGTVAQLQRNGSLQEQHVYGIEEEEASSELSQYMKSVGMSREQSETVAEEDNLRQLWTALRAHDDNTLETMFKSFLGNVFLEMNSQQDVIAAQSQRIREINRTEEDRLMDLQKSAESDLKNVIEQYEKEIQGSIRTYQEKIDYICGERDQLVEELHKQNSLLQTQRSREVNLLNSKVTEYELEMEQLKNELKRVRNEYEKAPNGERREKRVHAIDQFTTPRRAISFTAGSSLAASSTSTPLWHLRQAGNKTRHFNSLARHEVEDKEDEKEQQLDLEAEMKGEMEGEGEGESFHSAVSTGVMNSSQSIALPTQDTVIEDEQLSEQVLHTMEEPKILSHRATSACEQEEEREETSKRDKSVDMTGEDESIEYSEVTMSTDTERDDTANTSQAEGAPKRVVRNEMTSPDLEDEELTSNDKSSSDEYTSTVNTTPNTTRHLSEDEGEEEERKKEAAERAEQEYVQLDWYQFPNLVEYTFKVILCGDASVGKTSFLNQLCLREFRESTIATIGMSFFRHKFRVSPRGRVGSGKSVGVELQCWDTAGQEKFRSLPQSYFRNADAAILMYDVSKRATFANLHEWIERIEEVTDFPRLVIIGNKCDMGVREIERREALAISKSIDADYFEGSAKTGEGVWQAFQQISEILVTDFVYKNQGEVLSASTEGAAGKVFTGQNKKNSFDIGNRRSSSSSGNGPLQRCLNCN
ncbi:uncharacterized protein LOC142341861 isoform X2 [Convolutriloba macropyga]